MDNAVALVRAYLHLNGYFTVTEFPVVEALDGGGYRTATDLDVLAFRFARAASDPSTHGRESHPGDELLLPDSELGVPVTASDMLIGEVKEGRADMNKAMHDPAVLAAALVRFGCCDSEHAHAIVDATLSHGSAMTPGGHRIRMVMFGSSPTGTRSGVRVIGLGHVVRFLESHIRRHWDLLHQVQSKDPALAFLLTLEKARRGTQALDTLTTTRGRVRP